MSSEARHFRPAIIQLQLADPDERDIRTIPELVEFNSQHNPAHVFCVQARKQQSSISVSNDQLKQAILQCSDWLIAKVQEIELPHQDMNGRYQRGPPVALAMNSDIGLLVHLLSLLSLGVPVLLLSTRLSSDSIRHLILATSAGAIIGAPNHQTTIQEVCHSFEHVHKSGFPILVAHISLISSQALATIPSERIKPTSYQQQPAESFFDDDNASPTRNICRPHHYLDDTDRNVLILHSSGTTGMPKPIYSSHRHLLSFAAAHDFADLAQAQAPNVSTPPLFHVSLSR